MPARLLILPTGRGRSPIDEVLLGYTAVLKKTFWCVASRRAARSVIYIPLQPVRRVIIFLPLNWQKTIAEHVQEFGVIQKTRGYVLSDFRNNELIESFFTRLGERLLAIGELDEREQELMERAIALKTGIVPDLTSERAKAIYLAACLHIGMLKPQSRLDDIARKGGR